MGIQKTSERKQKIYDKFLKSKIKENKIYKIYKSLFEILNPLVTGVHYSRKLIAVSKI